MDEKTETVGSTVDTAEAGEGNEGGKENGEAFPPKVAERIALLRQRGIEVDEWIAEEFTSLERRVMQLTAAVKRGGKQQVVFIQTAKEVADLMDRDVINKVEARKLVGFAPRRKRQQPAGLARHAAARRRA